MNLLMVETSKVQVRNNYRRKLELDAEFVASVRQHGIIEPLVVRKVARGRCELVAGARRLAAAKKVKLKRVPCVLRDELTDAEAAALGVVENTHRLATNLLEESDAVAKLLAEGWDIDTAAAYLSRTAAHVRKVATLQRLSKASKDLLASGDLTLDAAFQLARLGLGAKDERDAALRLAGNDYQKPRVAKEAAELLGREYMLRLKDAPFVLSDAELLPKAGACSACPKRSGHQRELFDDVKAKDLCLDRACYQKKLEAFWAVLKDQHPDDVLEAENLFMKGGFLADHKYVDLDATDYSTNKPWRNVLPKDAKVFYARDLEGRLRRLAKKPKAQKRREAEASHRAQTGRTRDEEKAQRATRKANRARADELYADCVRAFAPTGPVLYWMIAQVVSWAHRTTLVEWLVRTRGEDAKVVNTTIDSKLRELVMQKVETMDGTSLTLMLFELQLCQLIGSATFDELPPELIELHKDVLGFPWRKPKKEAEGVDPDAAADD